ncbi:MAG: hypothetical protein NXI20_11675 [bacterium]|nr:hypothetical protein [bacterium]
MKGLAFNSMRYGKRYRLINFGEKYEFEVVDIKVGDEFTLKDLFTLEEYNMSDLTRFGKGEDFEIREI